MNIDFSNGPYPPGQRFTQVPYQDPKQGQPRPPDPGFVPVAVPHASEDIQQATDAFSALAPDSDIPEQHPPLTDIPEQQPTADVSKLSPYAPVPYAAQPMEQELTQGIPRVHQPLVRQGPFVSKDPFVPQGLVQDPFVPLDPFAPRDPLAPQDPLLDTLVPQGPILETFVPLDPLQEPVLDSTLSSLPVPVVGQAQPQPGRGELEALPFVEPPAAPKRIGKGVVFLTGLLGVLVGASISVGALYVATNGFSFSGTIDTSTIVIDSSGADIDLPVAVAAKVTPSVVNIDVFGNPHSFMLDDVFDDIFGDSALEPQRMGLGSGVILTEDGFILTNFHVVDGGEKFIVRLDNEELEAVIVGSDPSSDLAVIKVEARGLTPIAIGDSETVSVGEWVMAVGSPFGLEKSVSVGIVSALYRSTALQSQSGLSIFANLIQTDAAINPGNSGGALVNSQGELIGINTLINTTSGSSAGVGFAVPSNFAYSIAEQIMSGEEVAHPYLGIMLFTVDSSNAAELGVHTLSGAYVESVMPDSPAERAGLLPGDVITSIDNQNISTSAELIIEVRRYAIGQTVSLVVNREGQTHKIEVVLGSTAG